MGRARRSDATGRWFHVVNRGAGRSDIFLADRDRIEFGRLLGEAHDRFAVDVHAYCLMSNHYHLLLEGEPTRISDAMHHVGGVYAKHFNQRVGRDGPLFRGRFFSRAVLSPEYLVRLVRYIHRNPLAFLEPCELESYRWSSLRTHLGFRRRPHWLRTDLVAAMVGDANAMRALVGSEVTGLPGSSAPDVECAIAVVLDQLVTDAALQGVDRTVMTLLLDFVGESLGRQLGAVLSFPTVGAERSARSRARRRAREDPTLGRVVSGVLDLVG